MEFVVERKGYYRENEEEEEEEEEEDDEDEDGEEIGSSIISKFPFSSSSPSSSSKAYNNNNDYNYKRRQIGDDIDEEVVVGTRCYINNMNYKKQGGGGIESREISRDQLGGDHAHEREHMFDKVVTPSDVGKLNRLVIPKQHAEKYFPLHSSASSSGPEKSGALLDFEDRNGKQWRFRYSYWNSSQSYVMTKGWSRFVKEKKLDAGDIVSFHRSLTTTTTTTTTIPPAAADHEELGGGGGGGGGRPKYRLFIDWRHRSPIQQHIPVIPPPPPPPHGSSWGYNHHHHHQLTQMMNYNQFQPYFDHHRHSYNYGHQRSATLMGAPAAGSNIYYLTPSQPRLINIMGGSNHHDDDDDDQTVINSVPVLLHQMNPPPPPHPPTPTPTSTSTNSSSASPKRLRLFGVNMEEHCFPIQTDHHHQQQQHHVLPSAPYFTNISHLPKASSSYNVSSTTPPTLLPKSPNTTTTTTTSSLSFDLHLSDSH